MRDERRTERVLLYRGSMFARYEIRFTSNAIPYGLGVGLDQSDTDREANEAGHIMNFEPFHQLASVCFNRLHAQVEALSDIFRGMSFRDELQNFSLAHTELGQRTGRP